MRPVTIVFMGDSITEGQYVHHSMRWTEIVQREIYAKFSDQMEHVYFYNRGVSGETTRQGLERFPRDVQAMRPQIMTLQYGLNDCNCWNTDNGLPRVSEAAYKANLLEMINRARAFDVSKIILATNHPTLRLSPLINGQSLELRRKIYNDIVREVAAQTQVHLCDIDLGFSLVRDSPAELLLPEPDLLHLSLQGHRTYASLIFEYVASSLSALIDHP